MVEILTTLIRAIMKDSGESAHYTEVAGSGRVFTIPKENSTNVTKVVVDGNDISGYYTYDVLSQTVTIESGHVNTDQIVTIYYSYVHYDNTEILGYIRNAITQLDINRYGLHFTILPDNKTVVPNMKPKEQSLVANVCKLLMQPDYSMRKLPNVTEVYPRKQIKEEAIKEMINYFKRCSTGTDVAIKVDGDGSYYEPV